MTTGISTESFRTTTPAAPQGKKLRLAIIGCGAISEIHLDIYKKIPEVEIVAGVDIKPERLDWISREHGVRAVYKNWRDMLKEIRLDAVDVCTPNGVHAPAVIDSLNAGCHAMTEKPMAMNPRECERMIAAAKANRKKLCVGFQYRFSPKTTFLASAGRQDVFGQIMFVRVQALRRRGIPNWGVFGQKKLQGGGPLIDIGVHVIEAAHYTMGSPRPVAASGNIWTYHGNKPSTVVIKNPNWDYKTYDVEDLAVGHVRFDNGAIMQIESSFVAHIEQNRFDFSLMGTRGGGNWSTGSLFCDQHNFMTNTTPAFTGPDDFSAMFLGKLQNFTDACLHNTPLLADGDSGLAVQKIIDAIYRSAAAGREVNID